MPISDSLPATEGKRVVHLLAVTVLSRAGFNVGIMKCNFSHLGASLVVTVAALAGESAAASPPRGRGLSTSSPSQVSAKLVLMLQI